MVPLYLKINTHTREKKNRNGKIKKIKKYEQRQFIPKKRGPILAKIQSKGGNHLSAIPIEDELAE